MSSPISRFPYTGPVQAVIFDWAGTTVDHGCMVPTAVFVEVFDAFGIGLSTAQVRQFMGLEKKEHLRGLCRLPEVIAQWRHRYGRPPNEGDVDGLYGRIESLMIDTIGDIPKDSMRACGPSASPSRETNWV